MTELLRRLVSGEDEFLSAFVAKGDGDKLSWQPNPGWPKALPAALHIDDDDDWSLPAAAAERGEPDAYRRMRIHSSHQSLS